MDNCDHKKKKNPVWLWERKMHSDFSEPQTFLFGVKHDEKSEHSTLTSVFMTDSMYHFSYHHSLICLEVSI